MHYLSRQFISTKQQMLLIDIIFSTGCWWSRSQSQQAELCKYITDRLGSVHTGLGRCWGIVTVGNGWGWRKLWKLRGWDRAWGKIRGYGLGRGT